MELFGPDFEQYEEVQAELDRIAIAEADREAEANAINSASYSVAVDKSKAKKREDRREIYWIQIPVSNHGIYRRAVL